MTHIKVKRGLDIPIGGKPEGAIQEFVPGGEASPKKPKHFALNLEPFEDLRFKLLAKKGDVVKIGQPIAFDKATEERVFVAPASGVISEVRRGLKRRIIDIVIDVDEKEEFHSFDPININQASRESITNALLKGGLFANIRCRPFNRLADPKKPPKSIFVKAIESAPFAPPPELHVEGHEEDFQTGLTALSKLTDGSVHLVYHKDSHCRAFTEAHNVVKHTAEGPHPVGNQSVHIHSIDRIKTCEDLIWTVHAHDVVAMGYLLNKGKSYIERVISIAGPGILPDRTGYFKVRAGYPIESLIAGRLEKGLIRLISGDPLTGRRVEPEDFLGYYDYTFCAIPEYTKREFMHFFRLGGNKYSFSQSYSSGHKELKDKAFPFTTSLHGEPRAFITPELYNKVMPLDVPTMILVKAVMAEDYDLAEELGLLEVDAEDFALPTFVCPSKVEMTEIMKEGLKIHASEVLE